ncbi:MAG: endolytic transglycosylase MltG [Gammaproteobacteria bacterium]
MRIKRYALNILFIFLFLLSLAIIYENHFINTPIVTHPDGVTFVVAPGESARDVSNRLKANTSMQHPLYFLEYLYFKGATRKIKAGEYLLKYGSTPSDILHQFIEGDVVIHAFTLVDGWSFYDVMHVLENNSLIKHDLSGLTNKTIMETLGVPNQSPEGQFFPNTYFYHYGDTDQAILIRAMKAMQFVLNEAWQVRAKDLPYKTPYEALIAASIIEKEAAISAERQLISGIIVNRLNRGMRLQMDPTLIYGLGSLYQKKLTKAKIKKNTPYNTYKHKGLPPTPICMPGKAAIEAALHPEKTEYLYFVAKGDGSHVFSKTLEEQQKAIKQYISG